MDKKKAIHEIMNFGVYCNTKEEADFIKDIFHLNIRNRWNDSKDGKTYKKKYLSLNKGIWKFSFIYKYEKKYVLSVTKVKELLNISVMPTNGYVY